MQGKIQLPKMCSRREKESDQGETSATFVYTAVYSNVTNNFFHFFFNDYETHLKWAGTFCCRWCCRLQETPNLKKKIFCRQWNDFLWENFLNRLYAFIRRIEWNAWNRKMEFFWLKTCCLEVSNYSYQLPWYLEKYVTISKFVLVKNYSLK